MRLVVALLVVVRMVIALVMVVLIVVLVAAVVVVVMVLVILRMRVFLADAARTAAADCLRGGCDVGSDCGFDSGAGSDTVSVLTITLAQIPIVVMIGCMHSHAAHPPLQVYAWGKNNHG